MANLSVFLKLLYMLHFSVYRVSVPILCFAMLKAVFKTIQTLDIIRVEILQSIRTIGWILRTYFFNSINTKLVYACSYAEFHKSRATFLTVAFNKNTVVFYQ